MKSLIFLISSLILMGCSRPVTPPVTPVQPPTVESTPTSVPLPTVDTPSH